MSYHCTLDASNDAPMLWTVNVRLNFIQKCILGRTRKTSNNRKHSWLYGAGYISAPGSKKRFRSCLFSQTSEHGSIGCVVL